MPAVRVEDDAFGDERYAELAEYAGLSDADHARGKMMRLWRQCTQETLYSLRPETIARVLGENGVAALIKSRLGELLDDGSIRIKGTKGRIEWLKKLRNNGKFGKKGGRPKKNPDGYPHGFSEQTPIAIATATATALSPSPVTKKGPGKPAQSNALPGQAETIEAFDSGYRSAYGAKPTWSEKQVGQVKYLLRKHSAEEVKRRIANMFRSPPDWLKPPFDVGTLVQHFDKFAVSAVRDGGESHPGGRVF